MNFLNEHKDLPIVAHYVKHDRDKVLRPVFKSVDNEAAMPPDSRWRCTCEMAQEVTDLTVCTLDDVVTHFKIEGKGRGKYHEAFTDCELTAEIYKRMVNKQPKKKSPLGFVIPE